MNTKFVPLIIGSGQLLAGDHISISRREAAHPMKWYSHHGIVVSTDHVFAHWPRTTLLVQRRHLMEDGFGLAVVHYWAPADPGVSKLKRKLGNRIHVTPLGAFLSRGRKLRLVRYDELGLFAPQVIQHRALSQVGVDGYRFLKQNCEHFATWCASGHFESRQAEWLPLRDAGTLPANFPQRCDLCSRPHGWSAVVNGDEAHLANWARRWERFIEGQQAARWATR